MSISIEKKKKISFVSDWVVLAIVLILLWITSKINPFERQFKLDDITISHPYKGDTIKMSHLIVCILNINIYIYHNYFM